GSIPIYEPGLDKLVQKNQTQGWLSFTTDYSVCVDAEAVFIAVGTPVGEDGSADLQYVVAASQSIAEFIPDDCLVIVKSTVPVGTTDLVAEQVNQIMQKRGLIAHTAFNPEFLREGSAVGDFLKPERIVIGVTDEESEKKLKRMYAAFNRNRDRMIVMDRRSAELTKYAANCMLATRISFMNDLSRLCDIAGGDIESIRLGMGSDSRIGPHFLYAGIGYGGSCFPKDVQALIATAAKYDVDLPVVSAAWQANQTQRQWFIDRLIKVMKTKSDRKVAIWGLAFKPGTDDMREAPSIDVINALLDIGAQVTACDPAAVDEAKRIWGDKISYEDDPKATCEGATVLVVLTEWLSFREPDWSVIEEKMAGKYVFDARNLYVESELAEHGLTCIGIGRGQTCL
ncbi:MAG: UDP-glucose/GDP-mannose dehydrogenase family protein, partial [Ghiorsea sp.]|nr:UDP-glucose/GDP-mannose dehydrogenase family protein [Ghiorsea sp.]